MLLLALAAVISATVTAKGQQLYQLPHAVLGQLLQNAEATVSAAGSATGRPLLLLLLWPPSQEHQLLSMLL